MRKFHSPNMNIQPFYSVFIHPICCRIVYSSVKVEDWTNFLVYKVNRYMSYDKIETTRKMMFFVAKFKKFVLQKGNKVIDNRL